MRLYSVFFVILFFSACDTAGTKEDIQNQTSPWSWQLDRAGFDESQISIHQQDQAIASYTIECDLSDANTEVDDEEMPSVDKVITSEHPNGLLAVVCNIGAHSKEVLLFDPLSNSEQAVYTKTGSYYADWKLKEDALWIIHDQPCTQADESNCDAPFEQVEFPLPDF